MKQTPGDRIALPTFDDVRTAAARIAPHVRRTPVLTSETLSRRFGADLYFKCENVQHAGAFKSRGACNAVFALAEQDAARGVLTHSSGNHGAALARAAGRRGIPAWVVMPTSVTGVKRANVVSFGARVVDCEPTLQARESAAAALIERTGATLVHPYDDLLVIAGQGTALLEMESSGIEPAQVLVPVGGGGLLSGTALVARKLWPKTRVIGTEPAGADDAARSFASGELQHNSAPQTMADGLRGELSARTFALVRANVDDIVTVSEEAIVEAMQLIWQSLKILIEPSSAVPVAALLENRVAGLAGPVIIIVSGGNVDPQSLRFAP